MILKTKCKCGFGNTSEIDIGWAKDGSLPIKCSGCGSVYLATTNVALEDQELHGKHNIKPPTTETNLAIDTKVTINNKEHPLHNSSGTIIDKDYLHYKIKFKNGSMWAPHHWVLKKSVEGTKHKIVEYITISILALAIIGFIEVVKYLSKLMF